MSGNENTPTSASNWARFQQYLYRNEALGLELDISRMRFPDDFLAQMSAPMTAAFAAMDALEGGAIANPDENRQVGHYWLRAPELAPTPELTQEIEDTLEGIREFALDVHSGALRPPTRDRFRHLLVIGIGGSALGPQLFADALGYAGQPLEAHFLDNTDPDGIDRVLQSLRDDLAATLTLVVSKSGGTKETRNGMLETEAAYNALGLEFPRHAVAVTGEGSELDRHALEQGWLHRFPMWDWVGGRTSVFSAVGMLPAALLGFKTDGLLRGAREMDVATRVKDPLRNPAALLALMWRHAGNGHGEKDMVVLPYKDRLLLLSRYLQQLVMESLGKEKDLEGKVVHQGIVVYGNKGSTDQHAYIQQLREGPFNFFATFVQVLRDREGLGLEVDPGVTSGDYLQGFLLGTRQALAETGRESLTITLERLDEASLGKLIALFERAVGFYASLIGINAYHQPGVEAGKKAAAAVLGVQAAALAALRNAVSPRTAEEVASAAGVPGEAETVYHLLRHLAANPERGITRVAGTSASVDRFSVG